MSTTEIYIMAGVILLVWVIGTLRLWKRDNRIDDLENKFGSFEHGQKFTIDCKKNQHDFTKWNDLKDSRQKVSISNNYTGNTHETSSYQERTCTKCNYIERRYL